MKTLLKTEELAQLALTIVLFSYLPYAWWVYPALLLVPDISMLGYLINPKVGAIGYNIGHHKGLAVAVGLAGFLLSSPGLMLAGLILYGHASMDRVFGYGFKYADSFQHTHLGTVGKSVTA